MTDAAWAAARRTAFTAAGPRPPQPVALDQAVGQVLAENLVALTDLPPFDCAAMDGWAVAGPGPWAVVGEVLAGSSPRPLADGTAVRIATGAPLPIGAEAVVRRERGRVDSNDRLRNLDEQGRRGGWLDLGADIRGRGQECVAGDPLATAGVLVTPALAGMAAAAGYDVLSVVRTPTVASFVLGDELLIRGPARDGRVRDAIGPMLPGWLGSLDALPYPPQHVPDTLEALVGAIEDAACDLVITTGSTAAGPVDHLHRALEALHARVLVDGVAVRPGHPMVLAQMADGRMLVGLPGNPLAAVSALLTLVAPVLMAMRGESVGDDGMLRGDSHAVLEADVTSHPHDTRLVPVQLEPGEIVTSARPVRYAGPAMLRGLAAADGMAVVPPGAGVRGDSVRVLAVP